MCARVLPDLSDHAIQRVGWLDRLANGLVRNRLITRADKLGVRKLLFCALLLTEEVKLVINEATSSSF